MSYENFCEEIYGIIGAAVFENDTERFIELGIVTDSYIDEAHRIIEDYGYVIVDEYECEGIDYPSYCIWFEIV